MTWAAGDGLRGAGVESTRLASHLALLRHHHAQDQWFSPGRRAHSSACQPPSHVLSDAPDGSLPCPWAEKRSSCWPQLPTHAQCSHLFHLDALPALTSGQFPTQPPSLSPKPSPPPGLISHAAPGQLPVYPSVWAERCWAEPELLTAAPALPCACLTRPRYPEQRRGAGGGC